MADANLPNKIHNLDEGVEESFTFQVLGNVYKFKQPTTEELEKIQSFEDDDVKLKEYFFNFISKVDEKSPEFIELSKKLYAGHWKKFKEMIEAEFGG